MLSTLLLLWDMRGPRTFLLHIREQNPSVALSPVQESPLFIAEHTWESVSPQGRDAPAGPSLLSRAWSHLHGATLLDPLCICYSAPFRFDPCPLISVKSVLSISGFHVGAGEDVGHMCMHVAGRGRPLSVYDCLWNRVSHYTRSSPVRCTILDDIKADYLLGYKV